MAEHRKRRTAEERIAEIEVKIDGHKKNIEALETKKNEILNPKTRKSSISVSAVIKKAKEKGLSAKDIAKKLNITIGD